jgi:hypothetical protein
MMGQCIACRRRFNAAATPFQQGQPDGVFHATQTGTRRRQGHIRLCRTVGNAPRFENEQKKAKVGQIEAHELMLSVRQPLLQPKADYR